jgi:hypothetical protein
MLLIASNRPAVVWLSGCLTVCLILMGRYIPQLSFLEILLGDEPVLSPQVHFYQRLLALDDEEARDIADKYLKENPIGNLYDSVLIPALSLAEKDRHMNVVDETRTKFIHQSTRELIEELYEDSHNEPIPGGDDSSAPASAIRSSSAPRIVCIPARDEADEIVGTMVMQLLRRAGYNADALPISAVSTMLEQLEPLHPDVICVSALPPFRGNAGQVAMQAVTSTMPEGENSPGAVGISGGALLELKKESGSTAPT